MAAPLVGLSGEARSVYRLALGARLTFLVDEGEGVAEKIRRGEEEKVAGQIEVIGSPPPPPADTPPPAGTRWWW